MLASLANFVVTLMEGVAREPGPARSRTRQRPTIDSGLPTTVFVIAFLLLMLAIPVVAFILYAGGISHGVDQ